MFEKEYQEGYYVAVMEKLAGKSQAAMRALAGGSDDVLRSMRAAAKPAAGKGGGRYRSIQRALKDSTSGGMRRDVKDLKREAWMGRNKDKTITNAVSRPIPGPNKEPLGQVPQRLSAGSATPSQPIPASAREPYYRKFESTLGVPQARVGAAPKPPKAKAPENTLGIPQAAPPETRAYTPGSISDDMAYEAFMAPRGAAAAPAADVPGRMARLRSMLGSRGAMADLAGGAGAVGGAGAGYALG